MENRGKRLLTQFECRQDECVTSPGFYCCITEITGRPPICMGGWLGGIISGGKAGVIERPVVLSSGDGANITPFRSLGETSLSDSPARLFSASPVGFIYCLSQFGGGSTGLGGAGTTFCGAIALGVGAGVGECPGPTCG